MDVREFLTANIGKWFTQRTQYEVGTQAQSSARGELEVLALEPTAAELAELCRQAAIAPDCIWQSLRVQWNADGPGLSSRKQVGSGLIAFVTGDDNTNGALLQTRSDAPGHLVRGQYEFRPAGVNPATLRLLTKGTDASQDERIWFAGDNLRLRTIHAKAGDRAQMAFYSEIRRLPPKPADA